MLLFWGLPDIHEHTGAAIPLHRAAARIPHGLLNVQGSTKTVLTKQGRNIHNIGIGPPLVLGRIPIDALIVNLNLKRSWYQICKQAWGMAAIESK